MNRKTTYRCGTGTGAPVGVHEHVLCHFVWHMVYMHQKFDVCLPKLLLLCYISITSEALEDTDAGSGRSVGEAAQCFRNLWVYKPSILCKKPSAFFGETFRFSKEAFRFVAQLLHLFSVGEGCFVLLVDLDKYPP